MDLIVDPGEVSDGGALSDSAELVVDGSVTKANPALVSTQVGHGDAAQMRADSRATHDTGVAGVWNGSLWLLIKLSWCGKRVGLINLWLCQTTDENKITIPRGLENLTRGKLRDIELLVGITHVSITSDHLIVKDSHQGLDAKNVVSEDESLDHVHLCATDLVVTVLFVPNSMV